MQAEAPRARVARVREQVARILHRHVGPERNHCAGKPKETNVASDVTLVSYRCPKHADVELYRITGGGHTWPGSEFSRQVESILGPTTFSINANEVMWKFFEAHPRRATSTRLAPPVAPVATVPDVSTKLAAARQAAYGQRSRSTQLTSSRRINVPLLLLLGLVLFGAFFGIGYWLALLLIH